MKNIIDEIKELAKVNAINTCWSILNYCDECEDKKNGCEDIQCPTVRLNMIYKLCEQYQLKEED